MITNKTKILILSMLLVKNNCYLYYTIFSYHNTLGAKGYLFPYLKYNLSATNPKSRKHPESTYAKVLSNNKGKNTDQETKEINDLYKVAYNMYKSESYSEAITFIDQSLETIDNSPLIPKFELLKAYCVGKSASKETYKISLKSVHSRHPNSKEGRKASKIAKKL